MGRTGRFDASPEKTHIRRQSGKSLTSWAIRSRKASFFACEESISRWSEHSPATDASQERQSMGIDDCRNQFAWTGGVVRLLSSLYVEIIATSTTDSFRHAIASAASETSSDESKAFMRTRRWPIPTSASVAQKVCRVAPPAYDVNPSPGTTDRESRVRKTARTVRREGVPAQP